MSPGSARAIACWSVASSCGTRISSAGALVPADVAAGTSVASSVAETATLRSTGYRGAVAGRPSLISVRLSAGEARNQPPYVRWPSQTCWPGLVYVSATGFAYG